MLQAKTKKVRVHNGGLNFTEHSLHLSTYDMLGQVSAWFHAPRRVALAILFPRKVASRVFLLEQEKEKKKKERSEKGRKPEKNVANASLFIRMAYCTRLDCINVL